MAQYATLKAAINAVIKANGQKEITGTVLNEVLTSMVNSLGANYMLAGVATPSTNPGTPDQNVFYLAGEGGTYTNFNNIAIPNGISFLIWNGSWSSQTVLSGDGGVFDISAYKATGGTLATFADLSAALGVDGANVPVAFRKGGMSVKFVQGTVQSSDNKYVQYRLKAQSWSTVLSDWKFEGTSLQDALFANGGTFTIQEKNIEQGIWNLNGSKGSSTTRIRLLNDIVVAKGTIVRFTPGSNVAKMDLMVFDINTSSRKQASDWVDKDVVINYDGILRLSFRNSGNTSIVPSDYDATCIIDNQVNLGVYNAIEAAQKESSRGFYIDYKHIYSVDSQTTGSYISNNDYDSLWLPINANFHNIAVENATVLRYIYFTAPELVQSNQLAHNTTGEIPTGAKFCCITFKKSDNPNGYDNVLVRYTDDIATISDMNSLEGKIKNQYPRGFYIDPNHIYSVDGDNSRYMENNQWDAVLVPLDSSYKSIVVEGATAARYTFFSSPELVYANQVNTNTTGIIGSGAKYCCINMKKSDNPNGYDNMLVRFTPLDYATQAEVSVYKQQYPRGFYIDPKHIFNINGQDSAYIENALFDSIWVSINSNIKALSVENATPLRFCWFSTPELTYANYIGNNTTGVVPSGAKFCSITMRKSDNPNGYDNLLVRWEYNLDAYVTNAEILDEKKKKLIKVVKYGTSLSIRAKLTDSNDVVVRMWNNRNMTFRDFYVGANTLSDTDIINNTYKVGDIGDMVGAIGIDTFYYLYAQHGWAIPKMTVSSQTLDNSDIGSKWTDGTHYFFVGKVDGNDIYWLPEITYNSETGIYSASWDGTMTYPSSMTHVSGATHTSAISGSSDRYDLPVQTVTSRKFKADGIEISDNGTYYCDEFIIAEHIVGHSVGDASQWFPTPEYGDTLIDFDRTFIWKGSACTCNTIINTINPFVIKDYRGCIPIMPLQVGDYHSYSFIPKVKKQVNGHRVDLPFDSDNGTLSPNNVYVNRTSEDLYDVDTQPERCICYLKDNSNNYLIGMAGGCSLVRGLSTPESRNANISANSVTCTYGGASTPNKFYPLLLNNGSFQDSIVTDAYITELSCYYCWFDPSANEGQVYWYKDGDSYILYCHCQTAQSKLAINLPDFMEGMVVDSTIEKTDGATLLTTQVVSGRLYVSYDTTDNAANYIVVRVK